jgi:excisionase family DNA binding protein
MVNSQVSQINGTQQSKKSCNILTVQETAEYLRVSRSTIWRWCKDGTLSSAFKIGRNWRVHRSEVEGIIGQSLTLSDKLTGI